MLTEKSSRIFKVVEIFFRLRMLVKVIYLKIKMWYIYTMEYYSAIKRKKVGSFVETWVDLESVIQSEVSQKEKNIIY